MEFEGKRVIVTGGCGGMGLEIGEAFAAHGLDVVLADRNIRPAADLIARQSRVTAIEVDLASPDACDAILGPVLSATDAPGILVNAVGIGSPRGPDGATRLLVDMPLQDWMRVMEVNLDAVFHCIGLALPRMQERRGGRIINIASMAPRVGGVGAGSAYVTSKAAVIGMTKAIAFEVAKYGITVNAINPGKVETAMIAQTAEANAAIAKTIPLGRLGLPADVAHSVLFLASKGAAYITGSAIELNGGQYMGP